MMLGGHLSVLGRLGGAMPQPDTQLLDGVVAESVLEAMRTASTALASAGVPHALAGALAVGANGHPRATRDVDFLVGDEAFERHAGGIVTLRPGVPVQVNGVAVDYLSVTGEESHLRSSLSAQPGAVLAAGPLVYLKLKSARMKDRSDVVELLKAGVDPEACRRYLATNAPHLLPRLEQAVEAARREDE